MSPNSGHRTRNAGSLPAAVFFDMDDTIFDHSSTVSRALAGVRASVPEFASRSVAELRREYNRILTSDQEEIVGGRITIDAARARRFRRLAAFCGEGLSVRAGAEAAQRYRTAYQRVRRAVPGIRSVLERLDGRTVVGIVTNNLVEEQEQKLDFLGLRHLVDFMVVSEAVGVWKPDPAIFRVALARARVQARDAVMVGDSWASDVEGARAAGIRPVWFNRFRELPPAPGSVQELTAFLPLERTEAALALPR